MVQSNIKVKKRESNQPGNSAKEVGTNGNKMNNSVMDTRSIDWRLEFNFKESIDVQRNKSELMIKDAIKTIEEDEEEFVILTPSDAIKDFTFIQACIDKESRLIHVEIGTNKKVKGNPKVYYKDNVLFDEAVKLFSDFYSRQKIDITDFDLVDYENNEESDVVIGSYIIKCALLFIIVINIVSLVNFVSNHFFGGSISEEMERYLNFSPIFVFVILVFDALRKKIKRIKEWMEDFIYTLIFVIILFLLMKGINIACNHFFEYTIPNKIQNYILCILGIFLTSIIKYNDEFKEMDRNESYLKNISETAKNIAKGFGYPHKIFRAGTPYEYIVEEYNKACERGKEKGFLPIIVPVDETLEDVLEIMKEEGETIEDYLNYKGKSGKKILDERFKEYISDYDGNDERDMNEFIGVYEEEPEVIGGLGSLFDYSTRETKETIIFEIPTTKPWEVVAYIPFGGWNECPCPGEMMAICKYWYEEYGAIPVSITHDELEMKLPEPISAEKSLEVAKEHYAFTPDRVEQCTQTGTLSELKASIEVSKIWYFWWD